MVHENRAVVLDGAKEKDFDLYISKKMYFWKWFYHNLSHTVTAVLAVFVRYSCGAETASCVEKKTHSVKEALATPLWFRWSAISQSL